MSWQQGSGMGAAGNGPTGLSGGGPGVQQMGGGYGQEPIVIKMPPRDPPTTEYTLQGVMRFLQTEWHRHERDRNSWEIERQEMKGRIAALEGSVRRGDATQKALKRYVTILEKKVKEQSTQLKAGSSSPDDDHSVKHPEKFDRAARIQEKLKSTSERESQATSVPGFEAYLGGRPHEDEERENLKTFLDQCQAEFTYLMVTPANPMPPRESPPLPMMDDLREGDAFGLPPGQQPLDPAFHAMRMNHQQQQQQQHQQMQQQQYQQNHVRDSVPSQQYGGTQNHQAPAMQQSLNANATKNSVDLQSSPMVRSGENASSMYSNPPAEWPMSNSSTVAVRGVPDDSNSRTNHTSGGTSGPAENAGPSQEKQQNTQDSDGWDFNESAFPDPAFPSQTQQPMSNRPDTHVFPAAENLPKSPNRLSSHRRKSSSMSRRRSVEHELSLSASQKAESESFKLRYGLRGHLNTVRTVIFSGGGSPGEPEICTAGDDGLIKRFHIHRETLSTGASSDLDVPADFTHRGHTGAVLCLTSWSPSPNFSTGGRAQGDGWIFSGGQDATIRVWERGRVDPKATLDGHSNAVWAICVLPATLGAVFGQNNSYGSPDRILVASGAADGAVKIWAVSAPPQLTSPQPGPAGRRPGNGRSRGNSMSSGSQFPSSPQPNMASNSPFHSTLVHDVRRANGSTASPTSITPLSPTGEAFVVSYSDASIIVFDTKTGEEIGSMASLETYDGTPATSVNAVQATTASLDQGSNPGSGDEDTGGPTGGSGSAGSGVEGVIISGHEDRFIRFFDANSGQCTYNMLAHPAAISSLSLSPDGRELVSAGHDASLRFWSLEKRSCTQEMTCHRIMRGEGVCSVVWSQDGRWVVSGGGDGIVKVFAR